jgi:hypothetical protein
VCAFRPLARHRVSGGGGMRSNALNPMVIA